MSPQNQFESSRKQQRLKRISHNPEAEQQRLFAIGRFLEIQEERHPRPFLNTAFGKLPPELRVLIYRHLLVSLRFQPDSNDKTENAKCSSTASQQFIHLKKSSLSILRTCRQIKHEAHRILLKSGVPYFANAFELLSYLTGIGSTGRLRLEAFRIGALVFPNISADPNRPREPGVLFFGSKGDVSFRYAIKDPHVIEAFSLLMECESLRTIYMDMKQGEEITNLFMLSALIRRVHTTLYFRELHDWFVGRPRVRSKVIDPSNRWQWYRSLPSTYRTLISSGKPMGRDVLVKVDMNPLSAPTPFSTTCLGRLPQKLRIQIYHKLVATPSLSIRKGLITPGIRTGTQYLTQPPTPFATHAHLQASYLPVLRVCRSVYIEARPIFYQRQSYYTDNAKEFRQLIHLGVRTFLQTPFDCSMVTSLCVKDVLSWSDKKGYCLDYATLIAVFQLEKWTALRTIYFCMRVGAEMGYLEILFLLPRMSRGVVEFLDDSNWVIRQQYSEEEEWQLQYACFETNALSYKRGKNGEVLRDGDIAIQRRILRAQSEALEMRDGSERYVEVQIGVRSDRVMSLDMQTLSDQFSSLSLD